MLRYKAIKLEADYVDGQGVFKAETLEVYLWQMCMHLVTDRALCGKLVKSRSPILTNFSKNRCPRSWHAPPPPPPRMILQAPGVGALSQQLVQLCAMDGRGAARTRSCLALPWQQICILIPHHTQAIWQHARQG
jgi:hypothetical protein